MEILNFQNVEVNEEVMTMTEEQELDLINASFANEEALLETYFASL